MILCGYFKFLKYLHILFSAVTCKKILPSLPRLYTFIYLKRFYYRQVHFTTAFVPLYTHWTQVIGNLLYSGIQKFGKTSLISANPMFTTIHPKYRERIPKGCFARVEPRRRGTLTPKPLFYRHHLIFILSKFYKKLTNFHQNLCSKCALDCS